MSQTITTAEFAALKALLSAPTKQETVTPAMLASYVIAWHVTEFQSQKAAHKALRAAGFEYQRGTASNNVRFGYTKGYWRRGQRSAEVRGTTLYIRANDPT